MPLKFMKRSGIIGDKKNSNDPDYEEVTPVKILLKHTPDGRGDGIHCEVCGSAQASVRCDNCSGQVFCSNCDDVFHRHPRRTAHVRKLMEGVKPPLPPKTSEGGLLLPAPQPPPRKNKRGFSKHLSGSMMSLRTEHSATKGSSEDSSSQSQIGGSRTIIGSLRRFMGNRPLPPTPTQTDKGNFNSGSNLTRSLTSPNLVDEETERSLALAIPQTVVDINSKPTRKYPAPAPPPSYGGSTPPVATSRHYPPLATSRSGSAIGAPMGNNQRKLSLQQGPVTDKRQSLTDDGGWDTRNYNRSQSVSDEQWSQLLASQGIVPNPALQSSDQVSKYRSRYNSSSDTSRKALPSKGMNSSTSVCDLNTLMQPQQFSHQHMHGGPMNQTGSVHQLNMVPYNRGIMWNPPCQMCQGHAQQIFSHPVGGPGMKRTASNLSMNMSSASSEMSSYPWQNHIHPHILPMYPGCYPQNPHMMPGSMHGSSASIPDSMAAFSKVSPAPSTRSSSRRSSQKNNKSRSFSTADLSRSKSTHRSESDDTTSSPSMDDEKTLSNTGFGVSSIPWQCDHCTFINQAGSRVCGMCSKTKVQSNSRSTERNKPDRKYSGTRRMEGEEDEPSDEDKANAMTNRRNLRRERLAKSASSRRRRSVRSKPGSSGSADDAVDELERRLTDIKVNKAKGTDSDGLSSRIKEREREKLLKRREGHSSRYKSRSKQTSERSRTPGRQSTDRSPQLSPVENNSPQEDEVFQNLDDGFTKKQDSNVNSNEITLLTGDNDTSKTIQQTEYKKPELETKSRKSSKSSRSSTPASVDNVDKIEIKVISTSEKLDEPEPTEEKPQNLLGIPKPKQKSPSPIRRYDSHPDFEDPSFANTLDDVATMGTNEVADFDPAYFDVRPLSTAPINMEDINKFIPSLNYIEPPSKDDEKPVAAEVPENIKTKEDEQGDPINVSDEEPNKPEVNIDLKLNVSEKVYDNLEVKFEELQDLALDELLNSKHYVDVADVEIYNQETADILTTSVLESVIPKEMNESQEIEVVEFSSKRGSMEDINVRRSPSVGSSVAVSVGQLERKFTPLSFSSSDAAFYSPADSPEEEETSFIEGDENDGAFSQVKTIVDAVEEDLVTALESLKSLDDHRSSHDTIRSSVDDLPLSDDEFYNAEFQSEVNSNASSENKNKKEKKGTSQSSFEDYLSSDGYEVLSFQDALSGHSDRPQLLKSASDQAISKHEEDDDKLGKREVKTLGHKSTIDESHLTVEELIKKRKQDAMKKDGQELVNVIREAEKAGFQAEDVSVALPLCGDKGPLQWLMDNWYQMVDTVRTLASNYAKKQLEKNIGDISQSEAAEALRANKGDIWRAVTESLQQRQEKLSEITSRGDFSESEVAESLQKNNGDLESAYQDLSVSNREEDNNEEDYQSMYSSEENESEGESPRMDYADVEFSESTNDPNVLRTSTVDRGIYSTIVDMNSLSLEGKAEALLKALEEEAPKLSKDLKAKIVKAILEDNHKTETPEDTSDEEDESTIEESLEKESSPKLYEYFSTFEVEEDEEYEEEEYEEYEEVEVSEEETATTVSEESEAESLEIETGTTNYTAQDITEGSSSFGPNDSVQTESSPKSVSDEGPSSSIQTSDNTASDLQSTSASEMLYVRKEDVVFHDKRTMVHHAQIKEVKGSTVVKEPVDKLGKGLSKLRSEAKSTENTRQLRSSIVYESGSSEEEDEEESVSVTTGRLSLTLSSDKDGSVDVTSATVQKEKIETHLKTNRSQLGSKMKKNKVTADTTFKDIQNAKLSTDEVIPESASGTSKSPKEEKKPVKKAATSIIGMAIAKAMARETSVKEDSRDGSPFTHSLDDNSRGSTPASYSREMTPASSYTESEDTGLETPSTTPDVTDHKIQTMADTDTDDEDDLLRSLDTIPEEEEISERTESGKIISRSSAKNAKLLKKSNLQQDMLPKSSVMVSHEKKIDTEPIGKKNKNPKKMTAEKVDSDNSDSSTPKQLEQNEDGDDDSLRMTTDDVFTFDSEVKDVSKSVSSKHKYYNIADKKPEGNNYYNEIATGGLQDKIVEEDSNLYESLRSARKDIKKNKSASEQVTASSKVIRKKKIGGSKSLKSNDSKGDKAEEDKDESGSSSSSTTGAKLLADEDKNTVKRSPKNKTKTEESSNTDPSTSKPKSDSENEKSAIAKSGKGKSSKVSADSKSTDSSTKSKEKTKPMKKKSKIYADVDTKSSTTTDTPTKLPNTKSGNGGPATPVVVSAKKKPAALPKTSTSTVTTDEKKSTANEKTSPKSSEAQTSSKSSDKISEDVESSEESEADDDESAAIEQRVSVHRELLLPNLLDKLEGLKGREPDLQEVQEIKHQIIEIKKHLQGQSSDEERSLVSPEHEKQIGSSSTVPTIKLDGPEGDSFTAEAGPSKPHPVGDSSQYEQLRFDRTVRRLLAEGQAVSYEKAELAAHLLSLSFDEDDSVAAAQECSSIYGALHFLQQECELCAEKYPMRKMVSMLYCIHRCCIDCAKTYFTYQIKTKNIREMRCPFCNEPKIDTSEDIMSEYFNHLDILLKGIVDEETHELFQRKLRDLHLMSDPNFRWCNKCSSGFIANPRVRKMICPDCRDVTCAHCRMPWEDSHEGINCEAFAKWKQENDPENQAQGVAKHLAENGITCPKCKFTYSLAKGGCMHFTCTECKYEFCSGCGQPFRQGAKCPVGPYCERLGLHAHHPRNCLFYLRDKDPPQLQLILKENNVPFDTEPSDTDDDQNCAEGNRRCQVLEQKETPEGLVDDSCGRAVLQGNAGLCRLHYIEYLVKRINSHKLDPIDILDVEDLHHVLRRDNIERPKKFEGETRPQFQKRLLKLIKEQLPLE